MDNEHRCCNVVDTSGRSSAVLSTQFVPNMAFCRDSCSDNDSGICADSSSEQSCPSPNSSLANIPFERSRIVPKNNSTNIPILIPSLKDRREGRSRSQTRIKQPMKVRFADEVSISVPGTCLNSFLIDSNPKQMRPPPYDVAIGRRFQQGTYDLQPFIPDNLGTSDNYAALLRAKSSDLAKSVENLSLTPTNKLKQPNKIFTNHNKCHQQLINSSSAPSKIYTEQISAEASRSVSHETDTKNSHRNQSRPKFNQSLTPALQKLTTSATHSQNVQIHQTICQKSINTENERSFVNKNVKARLLSIDSKGVHTIELKKSEDGPFGFYISTGTYRNKKGIFVSRVNVPNLNLLLNVGDQILEIDNTPTKGRSLEQTQMMMFNKNQVVLKILPISSSAKGRLIM